MINLGAPDRTRRPLRLRLVPLRGQNNVQGGGDMGAIPNKLPGGQDLGTPLPREVRGFVRA
jgi:predicted molibdopterin-dependent oxidoreductase YjgC